MDADTRADYERRLAVGMHHRHAHLMDPKLYREYENDIAELAQIPPMPPVFFKIYEYIFDRYLNDFPNYRQGIITIIDDENFEHKQVWSKSCYRHLPVAKLRYFFPIDSLDASCTFLHHKLYIKDGNS